MFLNFFSFWIPRRVTGKTLQKYVPGGLSGALWGAPGDPPGLEIGRSFTSGAPRGPPSEFFRGPGALPNSTWGAPGAQLGPTWPPEAPRKAPGPHFGALGPALGRHFRSLASLFRYFYRYFCTCNFGTLLVTDFHRFFNHFLISFRTLA